MSIVSGTLAGALIAGGVYYAFSDLIRQRTERHRLDLHALSHRMSNPPSTIPAGPPPAVSRIERDQKFTDLLKQRWNAELRALFHKTNELEERVKNWGREYVIRSNENK